MKNLFKYGLLLLIISVCLISFSACELGRGADQNKTPIEPDTPKEITITFHKNDGSEETATQIVQANSTVTLMANEFKKDNYMFAVWTTITGTGSA
ncbi:MAG: InlB B-repeat-containing protein, partial [Alphaproteobacteria bacterium]|nr:InlB B-repeat-containing protein [Alphaproteobacteria bacterium]